MLDRWSTERLPCQPASAGFLRSGHSPAVYGGEFGTAAQTSPLQRASRSAFRRLFVEPFQAINCRAASMVFLLVLNVPADPFEIASAKAHDSIAPLPLQHLISCQS